MDLVSNEVRTFFLKKIQGLSRTHSPFFKDSIQCKKEPWFYVFFRGRQLTMGRANQTTGLTNGRAAN